MAEDPRRDADFLERFGAQAVELGWFDLQLFGVRSQIGTVRVDHCGALVLTERPAERIDACTIGFGNLTYYCDKPGMPRGVPILAFKG